jgi:hypothetical protein
MEDTGPSAGTRYGVDDAIFAIGSQPRGLRPSRMCLAFTHHPRHQRLRRRGHGTADTSMGPPFRRQDAPPAVIRLCAKLHPYLHG